jgi:hypothetical protein
MKIGINPASLPKPHAEQTALKRQTTLDRIQAAAGLMYEFQIYHDIVTPILDAGICPNFLRSFLISYNCKYADLLAAVKIGLRPDIEPGEVHKHLNRNISFLYHGTEKRPAIQSRSDLHHKKPSPTLRYMVLTTEFNDVQDYWVWLSSPHTVRSRQAVLLQILIALYVMSKSKLMHNDLRAPNIFVQRLHEPETWTYVINDGDPITIYTPYLAKVYDYDRGTSERHGINVFVKESGLYPADMDIFEENRDLVCLYKSLLGGHEVDSLIPEYFDVRNVNEKTEWFLGRGYEVPTSLMAGIQRLSHAFDLPPSDRVYRINDDMFMRDGSLNRDHVDLSALRMANEQHEKVVADYKVILEKCNAEKRQLEDQLAGLA